MTTTILVLLLFTIVVIVGYDRFIQKDNLVKNNYPLIGRFRYFFHHLRPYFRQYFGDDDAFAPRVILDWISHVAQGKTGYFSFDTFDTTRSLHDGTHQMIHSGTPMNDSEMKPVYPTLGQNRKYPFIFNSYIYRSAMSLGALSFEATEAMASACADEKVAFNTGEGALSVQHIPRVKFTRERKFFKYVELSKISKVVWRGLKVARLRLYYIEHLKKKYLESGLADIYRLNKQEWVFYTIDWDAPLEAFPKPGELTDEFGGIILQIGSALYGMRKKLDTDELEIDWTRLKKTASFARAVEIKLAQGAKQSGGILKAGKNTRSIAHIRGVKAHVDLVSHNRFPFYSKDKESEFLDFVDKISEEIGGKPIGVKLVISDASNIEPLVQAQSKRAKGGFDFYTIDGGDGGSGAAPISLSILFGKKIHEALTIAVAVLEKYNMRGQVKLLGSSKLYAPHMSARALALGADAVGNARSVMISGGCIRAGLCSGENGPCPVGMATMNKQKRRAYAQTIEKKIEQISNYLRVHNKGVIQVAAICGIESPSSLSKKHIAHKE